MKRISELRAELDMHLKKLLGKVDYSQYLNTQKANGKTIRGPHITIHANLGCENILPIVIENLFNHYACDVKWDGKPWKTITYACEEILSLSMDIIDKGATTTSKYKIISRSIDDTINAAIKAKNPEAKCHVIYSAYDSDENGDPINNLDDIAATGPVVFESNSYYGHDFSVRLIDPTWLDVAVVANDMIIETQDFHHIYLEGIMVIRGDHQDVSYATINMGS